MINFNEISLAYNINIKILILIYLFSFIPVYGGAFLILYSILKKVDLKNLLKLRFSGINLKDKKAFFGLIVFIVGWFLPYLYILFFGKNLSIIVYLLVIFIGFFSLFLILKKNFFQKIAGDSFKYKVEKFDIIDDKNLQNELWEIYSISFIETNKKAPCQQSIRSQSDFTEEMLLGTVKKYLLRNENNKVIGLGLIAEKLSNCTWISGSYFQKEYPQYYNSGKLYYFMGIAIEKDFRNMGLAIKILEYVIDDLLKNKAAMGFDHSYNANKFIPYFTKIVKHKNQLKRKYLDKQVYYLVTSKDN
ncbi:MAG: hypothetical protein WC503_06600 [Candidatus Shapirobacteria bacterium]